MKATFRRILVCGYILSCLALTCQGQSERAQYVFDWEIPEQVLSYTELKKEESAKTFWYKAINCGNLTADGGAEKTQTAYLDLSNTQQVRFKGTHSVKLFTDASTLERCNQNYTAERTELVHELGELPDFSIGDERLAQAGSTVWIGWSEIYEEMDESHWSTFLQFFHGKYGSATSSSVGFRPDMGIYIGVGGNYLPIIPREKLKEGVWYDWVVEFKYGYQEIGPEAGSVRIWVYEQGEPNTYAYGDKPVLDFTGRTIPAKVGSAFEKAKKGACHEAEIRMGIYRWQSADKRPEAISEADHTFIKYLGPTRMQIGEELGEQGFEAVKPRKPHSVATQGVNYGSSYPQLSLQPNPLKELSRLRIEHSEEGPGILQIMDLTGRVVRENKLTLSSGLTEVPIERGELAAGNYTLQLIVGEESQTLRIVIE